MMKGPRVGTYLETHDGTEIKLYVKPEGDFTFVSIRTTESIGEPSPKTYNMMYQDARQLASMLYQMADAAEKESLDNVQSVNVIKSAPSPTISGNVMCMDCRCGGYGCPGMPKGVENSIMKEF